MTERLESNVILEGTDDEGTIHLLGNLKFIVIVLYPPSSTNAPPPTNHPPPC